MFVWLGLTGKDVSTRQHRAAQPVFFSPPRCGLALRRQRGTGCGSEQAPAHLHSPAGLVPPGLAVFDRELASVLWKGLEIIICSALGVLFKPEQGGCQQTLPGLSVQQERGFSAALVIKASQ